MVSVNRTARVIVRQIVRQNALQTALRTDNLRGVAKLRTLLRTGLEFSDACPPRSTIRQVTWRAITRIRRKQRGCCLYATHVDAKMNSVIWNGQRQGSKILVLVTHLETAWQSLEDLLLGTTHVTALESRECQPAKQLSILHNHSWDQQLAKQDLVATTAEVLDIWRKTAPRLARAAEAV
jgi:hypothetical protein